MKAKIYKNTDEVVSKTRIALENKASTGLHAELKRIVREHCKPREMHLNIIKSMLNQALRDNAVIPP